MTLMVHPLDEQMPIFYEMEPAGPLIDGTAVIYASGMYAVAGLLLLIVGYVSRRRLRFAVPARADQPSTTSNTLNWAISRVSGLGTMTLLTAALLFAFPMHAGWIVAWFGVGLIGGTAATLRSHRLRSQQATLGRRHPVY